MGPRRWGIWICSLETLGSRSWEWFWSMSFVLYLWPLLYATAHRSSMPLNISAERLKVSRNYWKRCPFDYIGQKVRLQYTIYKINLQFVGRNRIALNAMHFRLGSMLRHFRNCDPCRYKILVSLCLDRKQRTPKSIRLHKKLPATIWKNIVRVLRMQFVESRG